MKEQLIETLTQQCHIVSSYTDAWGKPATVVSESKAKLLAAMGYPVDDEKALAKVMDQERRDAWLSVLPPVKVIRRNYRYKLELRLPSALANKELTLSVETEGGENKSCKVVPAHGRLVGTEKIDLKEYQAVEVEAELDLPLGYHDLSVLDNDKSLGDCRLIVAPPACYRQPQIEAGQRVWGPSVQLYCLRSERNWGAGDFTDLRYLVEQIADRGGDFVGLNPIHALYPAMPESASPYSPSSRRWLNIVYIDVTAVPEFYDHQAQEWFKNEKVQQRLAGLRAAETVDYTGVTEIKLEALGKAFIRFQQVLSENGERAQNFQRFVDEGGESLQQQATYDALQAYLFGIGKNAWGWPAWPKEYRDYDLPSVARWRTRHKNDINFYLYLQFLADEQLYHVDQLAKQRGMIIGLYRDLAVGVSEGSTEIWANKDLYCVDASVGAPPDTLGPLGQNWGLPPMDPVKLIKHKYQPIIDLFRANMRSCGALRIDHVMALMRLWWVPKGEDAKAGAYVHYPIDDLLGLLALESHRNRCSVIGEDLGTIPEGIFETLQENGVHSYRVFFFERSSADGGFISPAHYPYQAMAALTTHDMPTLRGYWRCDDLALGRELGLYPDEKVLRNLYSERAEIKQRILDSLHSHHAVHSGLSHDAEQVSMDRSLNYAMQVHMARGNSALLSVQLEDWLEMEKPVNVPGTSDEYPNWRRKLSKNLTEMFADPGVNGLTHALTDARKHASRC